MKLVSHMNELEQTIHNLEVIRDSHNWHNEEREDCKDAINRAITLLKEQEAQSVLSNRVCEVEPFRYVRKGFCPKCHQAMEWLFNRKHCGMCGQAVKWE